MMKKISASFVLLLMFGSLFAETWILKGTDDNKKVYWDSDETNVYNQKQVFMLVDWYNKALDQNTEKLSFNVYNKDETKFECLEAAKNGFYHIMEVHENEGCAIHYFVCENNVIIELIITEQLNK